MPGLSSSQGPGALPARNPGDLVGVSGMSPATGTAGQRKAKPTKRTRPPTSAPVRSQVRAATVSRDVKREVEAPLAGLPDPVTPGALLPGSSLSNSGVVGGLFSGPSVRLKRLAPEPDAYASLGVKSGGVTFYPAIEQGIGYDSNPDRSSTNRNGSSVLRTDGALRVQSNWSAHELTADLRGGYSAFPSAPQADRPDGDGFVRLRIDVDREAKIEAEGRYHIETERPGSPDLNAQVTDRPLVVATGAALGATKSFNRLSVGLRGSVEHVSYEDARLPNGTILPQGDRDQTTYGLRLRTAYELTPGMTPFVDALIDERIYDQTVDNAGFRRNSNGFGGRAGTTFEFSRKLTGEVSAGYQVRTYGDPRLRDARGPLADAALIWAATPLTTLRLRAQSEIGETTVANASGILTRRGTLEVQHDLRRNLSVTLGASAVENEYQGVNIREEGVAGSVKVDYRLTRWLALRASVLHERLKSNVASSSYTGTTYLVGVRFQP